MHRSLHSDIDDADLLERFYADGDREWLGILLSRYTRLLFGISMKYLRDENDAGDNVQQVFEKVLLHAAEHRITYFKSWLYSVTKNECLMRLRRKMPIMTTLPDELLPGPSSDPDTAQEKESALTELSEALLRLPEEQHVCLRLFFLEKKSYREVSAATKFSEKQVKSYLQNGKRNLKIMLQNSPYARK